MDGFDLWRDARTGCGSRRDTGKLSGTLARVDRVRQTALHPVHEPPSHCRVRSESESAESRASRSARRSRRPLTTTACTRRAAATSISGFVSSRTRSARRPTATVPQSCSSPRKRDAIHHHRARRNRCLSGRPDRDDRRAADDHGLIMKQAGLHHVHHGDARDRDDRGRGNGVRFTRAFGRPVTASERKPGNTQQRDPREDRRVLRHGSSRCRTECAPATSGSNAARKSASSNRQSLVVT